MEFSALTDKARQTKQKQNIEVCNTVHCLPLLTESSLWFVNINIFCFHFQVVVMTESKVLRKRLVFPLQRALIMLSLMSNKEKILLAANTDITYFSSKKEKLWRAVLHWNLIYWNDSLIYFAYCYGWNVRKALCIHLSIILCLNTQQLSAPLFNGVYTSSLVMYNL